MKDKKIDWFVLIIVLLIGVLVGGKIITSMLEQSGSEYYCNSYNMFSLQAINEPCIGELNESIISMACKMKNGTLVYIGKVDEKIIYNCNTKDEVISLIYNNITKTIKQY